MPSATPRHRAPNGRFIRADAHAAPTPIGAVEPTLGAPRGRRRKVAPITDSPVLAMHQPVPDIQSRIDTEFAMLPEDLRLLMSRVRVNYSDREPVLQWADTGTEIDTWREDYPYEHRLTRHEYDVEKRKLQIELLKLQQWVQANGQRLVMVFEGRDAAGKGGTIKRFMEHLNPRGATVVALSKPTERERT